MSSGETHESTDEITLDIPRSRQPELSLDEAINLKLAPITQLMQRIEESLRNPPTPQHGQPDASDLQNETLIKQTDDANSAEGPAGTSAEYALKQELQQLSRSIQSVSERVLELGDQLTSRLDNLRSSPAEPGQEQDPETEPTSATAASMWEQVILGDEFRSNSLLATMGSQLISDLQSGEEAAQALASRILDVRSTAPEQLPLLLKDFGEAYYRWQPRKGDDPEPEEEALVQWLEQRVTTGNRIDLVHRNDRFDSIRHNAPDRGATVVEVRGWIVLREGGKVYTKAAVIVE